MAITITISERHGPFSVGDNSKIAMGKMTMTGTYETNGFAVTPAMFGLSHIQSLIMNSAYVNPVYDPAASKVALFWTGAVLSNALAEVTNTANVSTGFINYQVIGW